MLSLYSYSERFFEREYRSVSSLTSSIHRLCGGRTNNRPTILFSKQKREFGISILIRGFFSFRPDVWFNHRIIVTYLYIILESIYIRRTTTRANHIILYDIILLFIKWRIILYSVTSVTSVLRHCKKRRQQSLYTYYIYYSGSAGRPPGSFIVTCV